MLDDFFLLGNIVRKFSFRGEVLIWVYPEYSFITKKIKCFYFKKENNFVSLAVEIIRYHKPNIFRVKFREVDSEEQALNILKMSLYASHSILPIPQKKEFYSHEILGFQVVDINIGVLGNIETVNQNTPQRLFEVVNKSSQILIPAADDFINKIDRQNNIIYVETPEGLVDLYV